jgi:uncharacterized surface protein with fasciclin (FAS1) repeats
MHTRMRTTKKYITLFAAAATLLLYGCKKWDDHNRTDAAVNVSLLEEINSRTELSIFSQLLVKSGLDKELSNSKTYTVWAPLNNALKDLDQAIINDTARLKQFLKNHIAFESYYTRMAQLPLRVSMMNGKRISFEKNKFDEATISEADRYVKNGVLHVVDKYILPLPSIWEFVNTSRTTYKQNDFLINYTNKVQDLTNAVIDSINSQTGQPVYKPGTDSVIRNVFNDGVYDLTNENKMYTYVVLNNTLFDDEQLKLAPFFKTPNSDTTYNLSAYYAIKDMAIEITGYPAATPDPLIFTSKFNVRDTIVKSAIVETRKCSNGVVYIVNAVQYSMKEKIPSIILQGEIPFGFSESKRSSTFYRLRTDSSGRQFNDIVMANHGVSGFNIAYRSQNTFSTTYKVYWVAVNDFQPTTFQQRLAIGNSASATFPYVTVPLNNYKEVLLGEYPMSSYGTLFMFLTSALSTANGVNSLSLDYIRLEPKNL